MPRYQRIVYCLLTVSHKNLWIVKIRALEGKLVNLCGRLVLYQTEVTLLLFCSKVKIIEKERKRISDRYSTKQFSPKL